MSTALNYILGGVALYSPDGPVIFKESRDLQTLPLSGSSYLTGELLLREPPPPPPPPLAPRRRCVNPPTPSPSLKKKYMYKEKKKPQASLRMFEEQHLQRKPPPPHPADPTSNAAREREKMHTCVYKYINIFHLNCKRDKMRPTGRHSVNNIRFDSVKPAADFFHSPRLDESRTCGSTPFSKHSHYAKKKKIPQN